MEAFYQTVSTFCFTLLGLWWAVVQLRHSEWTSDVTWRRMAYSVHLSFLVPGVMSLGAQTAGEIKIIWRLVFVASCALAVLGLVFLARARPLTPYRGWFLRHGRWLTIGAYVIIAVVAFAPELAQQLDPKLTALQIEGWLLTLVVMLGVSVAWDLLVEPKE